MLELGDERLGGESDHADDDHRAEDAVRVEVVLRVGDDQPQALLGTQELADDRANDREPERHVETRDDPRQR